MPERLNLKGLGMKVANPSPIDFQRIFFRSANLTLSDSVILAYRITSCESMSLLTYKARHVKRVTDFVTEGTQVAGQEWIEIMAAGLKARQ